MKKINVKGCEDCPFNAYSTTSWEKDINKCNLLQEEYYQYNYDLIIKANYFIDFYRNGNGKVKSKNRKTLDNCPLLKNNVLLELQ